MLFQSWSELLRIAVVGPLAYAALAALLRVSGNRTLSKLNAFDLVVTVALGSTLPTVLLSRDVSLAGGSLALVVLVGLQYAVAWSSVRSATFRRLVRSEPALLVRKGVFQHAAMRAERVTEDEILAVVRGSGRSSLHGVEAVVPESDGSYAVLTGSGSTRESVESPGQPRP